MWFLLLSALLQEDRGVGKQCQGELIGTSCWTFSNHLCLQAVCRECKTFMLFTVCDDRKLKNYQTPEVKSVCFVPRRPTGSIISATHCYSFKMVQEPQSTATADCSSQFFSVLFLLISVTFEAVKIDDPRTQPCSAFSDLKKHMCMHIVTVVWFTDDLKRKLRQALPLNHMEDFKVISSEDLVILRQSRVPWKLKELFQPGSLLSLECPWQSSDVSNGSQWRSVSEQLWKRASKKMENTVA